jgi:hypothetical protein
MINKREYDAVKELVTPELVLNNCLNDAIADPVFGAYEAVYGRRLYDDMNGGSESERLAMERFDRIQTYAIDCAWHIDRECVKQEELVWMLEEYYEEASDYLYVCKESPCAKVVRCDDGWWSAFVTDPDGDVSHRGVGLTMQEALDNLHMTSAYIDAEDEPGFTFLDFMRGIDAIASEHNEIMCRRVEDIDDYDRGEAHGIRKTLKALGFELELDGRKAIAKISIADYVKE